MPDGLQIAERLPREIIFRYRVIPMTRIRINRFIASSGAISRRKADELILNGRVRINARKAVPGDIVDPASDEVMLDNKLISAQSLLYLAMYKPRLMLTSMSDPEGRACVKDLIPKRYLGVFPVGRLDFDAEGLLILTNDGNLAHTIHHPTFHVPKVYMVKVSPCPDTNALERMERGVYLDGIKTLPAKVQEVRHTASDSILRITLVQGLKNQIKRMAEAVGLKVVSIKRISVGPINLKGMSPGQIRELTSPERESLHKMLKKHKKT
jgi:23S rRNA pseudouridine2605 synthase